MIPPHASYASRAWRPRQAFTLIEVIIATGLLTVAVVLILESGTVAEKNSRLVDSQMAILEDAERTRTTIQADMARSAVMLEYDPDTQRAKLDGDGKIRQLKPNVDNREARDAEGNFGTLPSDHSLRFVLMRTTRTTRKQPEQESASNTALAKTQAVGFEDYVTAPISPFFIVNTDDSGNALATPDCWRIAPVWESDRPQPSPPLGDPDKQEGLNFEDNANEMKLRLYRYVLVPESANVPGTISEGVAWDDDKYPDLTLDRDTPGAGGPDPGGTLRVGMLLRQYKNPGDANTTWVTTGPPLATGIQLHGFQFETYRSLQIANKPLLLGTNEVRLRMTIHRPLVPGGRRWPTVSQHFEIIAAMQRLDY
jgi:type II secretory pathway component PulJ